MISPKNTITGTAHAVILLPFRTGQRGSVLLPPDWNRVDQRRDPSSFYTALDVSFVFLGHIEKSAQAKYRLCS